jgi:hypothetical protein
MIAKALKVAAAAAAVAGLVAFVVWLRRPTEVLLLNGLSRPVAISFDGKAALQVEQSGRARVKLPAGPHKVEVRAGDEAISSEEVLIPPPASFAAYNVLGAAPLYWHRIHYSDHAGGGRDTPDFDILAGPSLVVRAKPDYLFEKPPASVEVDKHSGEAIRTQVEVAGEGSWATTVNLLFQSEAWPQAVEVLDRLYPVERRSFEAAAEAHQRAAGSAATIAWLQGLAAREPGWYDCHRLLQWLLRREKGAEATREFYRRWRDGHPGDALAPLLLARVEGSQEAEALLRRLLAERPGDRRVALVLAAVLARSERWEEVAGLLGSEPKEIPANYLDLYLEGLVATGKASLAAKVAEERFEHARPAEAAFAATVAERAAAGSGKAVIERLLPRRARQARLLSWLETSPEAEWQKEEDGEPPDPAALFTARARKGPAAAWKAYSSLDKRRRAHVHQTLGLALVADFLRMGEAARAAELAEALEVPLPLTVVQAWVERGEAGLDLELLVPEQRAALDLARALALEGGGRDGKALRESAMRRDVLHGLVHRAAKEWPKGAPPPANDGDVRLTFVRRAAAASP